MKGISDWHPPFYILCLKLIVGIIQSPYAVVCVQYLFFAYVFIHGITLLYKNRGVSFTWLIILTLVTIINCGNMVHFTTIWKDIPYAICVLWLTVILAYILWEDKQIKWYRMLELILALVGTCLFRQNGIVPYILVSILLVCMFRKRYKILTSVIVAFILILLIKIPLYQHIGIVHNQDGGIYIGLGQDIMGVYYNGGNLSEDGMEIVTILSNMDVNSYVYSPYRSDASYGLNVSKLKFIRAYTDTFFKNPVLMIRTIMCRLDAVWNIFMGQDGRLDLVGYTGTTDYYEKWVNLWGKRKDNFITELIQRWVSYSISNPILNTIQWRSGLWFLLVVFSFLLMCWRKKIDIS